MNTIDIIMALADEYRNAVMFPKQKREELRTAIERALTPGTSAVDADDALTAAYMLGLAAGTAELRRLHTEVERLRSMTAMTMGIGRGDGNLFVHGDYDSIKAAQSLVFRAERMKKALKDIRSLSSINSAMNPNSFALTAMLGDIHHIADAALSKENIND